MYATPNQEVEPSYPRSGDLNERFLAYLEHAYSPEAQNRRFGLALSLVFLSVGIAALGGFLGTYSPFFYTLIPLALGFAGRLLWSIRRIRRAAFHAKRMREVVQQGELVTAYLVRSSRALAQPGNDNQPCLALFSFQMEVGEEPEYMRYLAGRVAALKERASRTDDERDVALALADERFALYRRRPLPLSLTDGSTVFLADLWVRRAYLKAGHLTSDTLTCLAERGEGGGIELIPDYLLNDPSVQTTTESADVNVNPGR